MKNPASAIVSKPAFLLLSNMLQIHSVPFDSVRPEIVASLTQAGAVLQVGNRLCVRTAAQHGITAIKVVNVAPQPPNAHEVIVLAF